MNELMITFMNGGYIYYKTDQVKADKAFDEFLRICEEAGMNLDNMFWDKAVLRNDTQGNIDTYIIKY